MHDEAVKIFPEYAHLIKWHLVSSDEPMHYAANTMYHASDKDCWGKRKGEPTNFEKRLYFGDFPIQQKVNSGLIKYIEENDLLNAVPFWNCVEPLEVAHPPDDYDYKPKYQLANQLPLKWHECPFDTEQEAFELIAAMQQGNARIEEVSTSTGEGKTPDLKAARSCAVWPNATLAQLSDKNALMERLPALMHEFKADMEKAGFVY
jgi:hypothetical protein